jgi:type VI secretion system FHA domain protein
MSLTLTIATYRNQPPAQATSQRFEGTIITLGRGSEADWALPDPEQHLSKKHCIIQMQGGQYSVTDTSTNGLYLNRGAQPLGRGQSAPLRSGDRLGLGDYEIVVRVETGMEAQAGFGATPFQPFGGSEGGAFGESDPFALGAQQSPFTQGGGDVFGAPAAGFGGDPFGPAGGGGSDFAIGNASFTPTPSPGNSMIPPDFGAAFPPDPALAPPLPGAADNAPLIPEGHDFLGGAPQTDAWQQEFSQPDHVAAQNVFFKPPEVNAPAIPENWDAVFNAPSDRTTPNMPPSPVPPTAPPPQAGFGIPQAAAGLGMPAGPAPGFRPPPMPPAGPADAALMTAFLQGCGLPPNTVAPEAAAETMQMIGQIFRELVGGLRDVLTTRAMIKAEYRVEQTVIRSSNNNPLKFAMDPEQALSAMLGPPRQGYMPAVKAAQEGFKDMKAHELALMAGMQAAVQALFRQFDPEQLKQRLEKSGSVLESLLPGAKKAKYWEVYEQQYKQITREMSEDVRGTFGRAFAEAYEQQSKKL